AERFVAVLRFLHVGEAELAQQAAHDAAHGGEVVDDQDVHVFVHVCCSALRTLPIHPRRPLLRPDAWRAHPWRDAAALRRYRCAVPAVPELTARTPYARPRPR